MCGFGFVEATVKVRTWAAVAALALGTAIGGGAAHANTYMLTVNGCGTPSCLGSNTEVGTVTVTQDASLSGVLDFSVALDNNTLFNNNNNGQHHAFVFDLNGGSVDISGQTYSAFTSNGVATTHFFQAPGTPDFSDSPFGSAWTNAVDYDKGTNGNDSTNASNFSFKLDDALHNLSVSMLTFGDVYNGKNIIVAADVYGNGVTGNVGAVDGGGGVPEPATWGLMIAGVFCIGAALRQQRRQALTAA
jgi:hypothetical protein